jgi:pyrroline-5-carboxylate reductase
MLNGKKIGFIGAGNMGQALMKGLLKKGIMAPENIIVSDLDKGKLQVINYKLQVMPAKNNREVVEKSDIIILSVKPKDMEAVLREISVALADLSGGKPFPLMISIAAGVTTAYIEEHLGKDVPVVRVMPNTPALIGAGMTAISRGRFAGAEEERTAEDIFRGVGETVRVREELMDAVTAVSGSGPAYVFAVMESLVKAGMREGLSPDLAQKLVSQTFLGSVRMARETAENLSALRERVTSPGGTTEAALRVFKEKGLEGILAEGVRVAARRAKELQSTDHR